MPRLVTTDIRMIGVTRVIEDRVDGMIVVRIDRVDLDQAVDVEVIVVVEVEDVVTKEVEAVVEEVASVQDQALMDSVNEVVRMVTIVITTGTRVTGGRSCISCMWTILPLDY